MTPDSAGASPRLRVLFLLAVGVGLFVVRAPAVVLGVAGSQVLLAFWVGIPPARVVGMVRKLTVYGIALATTFAFFPDGADPRWLSLGGPLWVSLSGLETAALMVVRIAGVVVASEVIRHGDPAIFTAGLAGLGVPRSLATTIDVTLGLIGSTERAPGGDGGGRGNGRGGGRGRHRGEDGTGFLDTMREFARGDVHRLIDEVRRRLEAARDAVAARQSEADEGRARDLGVVAGVATAMLALKILKLLPGIPFAPGHKTVLLIPLYVVAGALTRGRWGATLTGTTMGTIAFLMGDGRYGVFEVLKHIAPGVLVDCLLPVVIGRSLGVFGWCLFGVIIAVGRFATVVAITFLVAAPEQIYVLLAVPAVVHVVFGGLSGIVSFHLVRALDELRDAAAEDKEGI